jgi:hypothetical protein
MPGMPNWCMNTLTVEGPRAAVAEFLAVAAGRDRVLVNNLVAGSLSTTSGDIADELWAALASELAEAMTFSGHLPCPPQLHDAPTHATAAVHRENLKLFGASDWYEWQTAHWGAKWDIAGEVQLVESAPGRVEVRFDTAWAPPTEWLAFVANAHPTLTFTLDYEEPGMVVKGRIVLRPGKPPELTDLSDTLEYDDADDADDEG